MRKRVFQDYGYFDEQLTHGEDTDLWIRIGIKSKACYTSKVLSFYYLGGDPFTRSGFRTRIRKNLLSGLDSFFYLV
jgi:GT2 family glycosyltransferase